MSTTFPANQCGCVTPIQFTLHILNNYRFHVILWLGTTLWDFLVDMLNCFNCITCNCFHSIFIFSTVSYKQWLNEEGCFLYVFSASCLQWCYVSLYIMSVWNSHTITRKQQTTIQNIQNKEIQKCVLVIVSYSRMYVFLHILKLNL